MSRKVKKGFIIAGCVIGILALAFFVTSFVLAGVHEQSVVAEWQSWGNAIKNFFVGTKTENVENTAKMFLKK